MADEKNVVTEGINDPELGPAGSEHEGDNKMVTLGDGNGAGVETAGFHRRLTKRQIMMMTFGAGIGTGLWVGTGQALHEAGPGGMAVAYTIQSFIVWCLYMSIGEMTTYRPVHGGFIRQAAEYVDPALAYAEGFNFWFQWVMIIPAEITAAVSVLKFWPSSQSVPLAAYITIFLVALAIPNYFPVRWYGHFEFVMSWVKLLAVFVMIFFMFIMASGGVAATHGPLVFHYWKSPGAFVGGMKGIAQAFVQAGFSFGSAQHIAIIAGEAIRPRKTIKSVVMPIFWRIFCFFIVNIWLVGMVVPYNNEDLVNGVGTLGSPFVIALKLGHQMWLAHTINGFIFLTVVSCGVTSVYISSRALTAMADIHLIHPVFGKKDKRGRPWLSLTICTALGGGLCYLNLNKTAVKVYGWFSALVAIATFLSWLSINWAHINFRRALKAQGIDPKTLPFRAPFAPYTQYVSTALVLFIMGCEMYLAIYPSNAKPSAEAFFTVYLALPLFIANFVGYKLWFKTKMVKMAEVDLSEAKIFDEDDRIRNELDMDEDDKPGTFKKFKANVWQSTKNVIFG
ncbi:amino acid transporter [Niveomyces insectorum RCEF 264]|uniref:Amino acid transporter n=1 Tax=Niveomyces insectorum RCEF 264 TaxID=1081102 RepID=A0A167Q832_9HYPO|nr:amino acid transporter [Niveomyces insectorum RCEF 264]